MSNQVQQTPQVAYETALAAVAGRLRSTAAEIERAGKPQWSARLAREDRVGPALEVLRRIWREQTHLTDLVRLAVAADHPAAVKAPGALLDAATTGLVAKWAELARREGPRESATWMEELAEAALRGAGVIA